MDSTQRPKQSRIIFWLYAAIIVLIVLTVGMWVWNNGSEQQNTNKQTTDSENTSSEPPADGPRSIDGSPIEDTDSDTSTPNDTSSDATNPSDSPAPARIKEDAQPGNQEGQ